MQTQDGKNGWLPIYKDIVAIQHELTADLRERVAIYDHNLDVRFTGLAKIGAVLGNANLSISFTMRSLIYADWWKTYASNLTAADIEQSVSNFGGHIQRALVLDTFGAVETTLRAILRGVAPTACSGGAAEFKSVYESLLKSHLSARYDLQCDLLDLMREIRNTVHNNTVYVPKHNRVTSVAWKGITYTFTPFTTVNFVTWDFIRDRIRDLIALLQIVMRDANVIALPGVVIDHYFQQNPQYTKWS